MGGDPGALSAIKAGARALEFAGVDVSLVPADRSQITSRSRRSSGDTRLPVDHAGGALLLRALPPSKKLGIVFASTATFTDKVRRQCGIPIQNRIVGHRRGQC